MACCLAVALVIAVVRAAWFRLFPARRPARAGFAPPARRPAPRPVPSGVVAAASADVGADAVVVDGGVAAVGPSGSGPGGRVGRPLPNRRASARGRPGSPLVDGALGVAGYAATAEVGLATGLVHLAASRQERLVVTVAVLAVAAVLWAGRRSRGRGNPVGGGLAGPASGWVDRTGGRLGPAVGGPAERERRRGSGLVVAGVGWSVASVLDMHLLGPLALGTVQRRCSGDLHCSGHPTAPGMAEMPGMSPVDLPGMSAGMSTVAGHGFGPAELVLHGPGLMAVVLGCLLALGAELRRPAHSPLSPRPRRAT
ncbi:MAG: hypothetical protein QOC75_128 [Pseudonocardiales bacterium]|nr:hypothetical protein [Pseudonocardiales bacterium]